MTCWHEPPGEWFVNEIALGVFRVLGEFRDRYLVATFSASQKDFPKVLNATKKWLQEHDS